MNVLTVLNKGTALTVVNVARFTALFTVTRYKKSQKTDIPEKTQTPLTCRSLTDLIASFLKTFLLHWFAYLQFTVRLLTVRVWLESIAMPDLSFVRMWRRFCAADTENLLKYSVSYLKKKKKKKKKGKWLYHCNGVLWCTIKLILSTVYVSPSFLH